MCRSEQWERADSDGKVWRLVEVHMNGVTAMDWRFMGLVVMMEVALWLLGEQVIEMIVAVSHLSLSN